MASSHVSDQNVAKRPSHAAPLVHRDTESLVVQKYPSVAASAKYDTIRHHTATKSAIDHDTEASLKLSDVFLLTELCQRSPSLSIDRGV